MRTNRYYIKIILYLSIEIFSSSLEMKFFLEKHKITRQRLQNYYCTKGIIMFEGKLACANNDDTHSLHVRENFCCSIFSVWNINFFSHFHEMSISKILWNNLITWHNSTSAIKESNMLFCNDKVFEGLLQLNVLYYL